MSGDQNRTDDLTGTPTTCGESPSIMDRVVNHFTHMKIRPRVIIFFLYHRPPTFIALPTSPLGNLGHWHCQQSCSNFHGLPLSTPSLLLSFFIYSSLSVTIEGGEDSHIHLARLLCQSLEMSLMFQSDLLGLRTKPCPRNMVRQPSSEILIH